MYAKVNSLGLFGLNAFPVDVEIETSKGTPSFDIIGLADTVVKESRERIRSALRASYIAFPISKIIVNLAPADTKKTGSTHDLAIFTALLRVTGNIDADISKSAFIGEVSLNGDVRGINGVLPMVLLAKKEGFTEVFVPASNAFEASVVEGITVYGVNNTSELINHFSGSKPIAPQGAYNVSPEERFDTVDFADVKGQQAAKKALEIAAAGGHNVMMIGAPGSGTFMLIAAMNPCPCGYYGNPNHECRCSKNQVAAYLSRISGPLLDRFDIHVRINPVDYESMTSKRKEESSAAIRERVQKAREIQNQRFKGTEITCNARISDGLIAELCPLSPDAQEALKNVFEKMGLSARGYNRILKLSRTIADMSGSEVIDKVHITQAVQFRTLDRQFWGK